MDDEAPAIWITVPVSAPFLWDSIVAQLRDLAQEQHDEAILLAQRSAAARQGSAVDRDNARACVGRLGLILRSVRAVEEQLAERTDDSDDAASLALTRETGDAIRALRTHALGYLSVATSPECEGPCSSAGA